ncbi:hypothetical protein ACIRS1_27970 [Kitasatospora sp. NPDC101176]|uniref:hypothetical protein n=1 Tax=Kitasatospora sp. NPDC101176 TaxID=3364099 RepID=UPI0038068B61
MTATDAAPDHHHATAEDRWQHIQDRLTAIEQRIHRTSAAALDAVDTHLAHLDALRRSLARDPWPPQVDPGHRRHEHRAGCPCAPTDATGPPWDPDASHTPDGRPPGAVRSGRMPA